MMNPNNNNNKNKDAKSLLIDIINKQPRIIQEGDVIDLAKNSGILIWDALPSKPANIYDNIKIVSTEPQSRSEDFISSIMDDLETELKIPKNNIFESLYKRWKDLNFICNVLDNTVYVESMDKSKFFIINENSFTIKSNFTSNIRYN